jgi:hypothetical protein
MDHLDVQRRLRETAESSGRGVEEMRTAWVLSVAKMPAAEMQTLLQAHYPTATEARSQKAKHEATTGHYVYLHGWRGSLGSPRSGDSRN